MVPRWPLPIVRSRSVLLGMLGCVLLVMVLVESLRPIPGPYLEVTFLAVGQGDAILIETPDGVSVLIDGGPDGAVLAALAAEYSWLARTIDLVVSTHPDKDHVGGLVPVLTAYEVGHILQTENAGDTEAAAAYRHAAAAEVATITNARAGQVFALGASTTMTVLAPATNPELLESNTASIVVQLTYGETDFLLTGDAPLGIEQYLVSTRGSALASEVLKLGHHGSRTSTGALFLQTVAPAFAVVSAGPQNTYGHPHTEVVERVAASGARLLSTATGKSVRLLSDGQKVWVEE